eukprot:3076180-Prymnesium_polylepis.2
MPCCRSGSGLRRLSQAAGANGGSIGVGGSEGGGGDEGGAGGLGGDEGGDGGGGPAGGDGGCTGGEGGMQGGDAGGGGGGGGSGGGDGGTRPLCRTPHTATASICSVSVARVRTVTIVTAAPSGGMSTSSQPPQVVVSTPAHV